MRPSARTPRPASPPIRGVLETCVYATDLEAAERFYAEVLGLELLDRQPGRHVFFRCGRGVFLVFDPAATRGPPGLVGGAPVPCHGCEGPGHAAFAVPASELDGWRPRLEASGVEIESDVRWPGGGRSLYFRDPAGNCIELATPAVWGIPESGGDRRADDDDGPMAG